MSFHTATLSRALQKNNSYNHLGSLHRNSNSSLNNAFDISGNWASVGSLGEEDPDALASSMTSATMTRRMTRSRSLDDMLDIDMRQRRVLKKSTLKRRVGSSKFYTEGMLNVLNKGKGIFWEIWKRIRTISRIRTIYQHLWGVSIFPDIKYVTEILT